MRYELCEKREAVVIDAEEMQEPTLIVEQLDDGRIRYHSKYDGIVTGRQVGLVAVRDTKVILDRDFQCILCGRPTSWSGDEAYVIDHLTLSDFVVATSAATRKGADIVADSYHQKGESGWPEWRCEQFHAEADGKSVVPFRHWLRERAS